jgi:hypothetical protein
VSENSAVARIVIAAITTTVGSHRATLRSPTKKTLTEGLEGPKPARQFEVAVEEGHAQVPLLAAAIAIRDFEKVLVPTLRAQQCLDRARVNVGAVPDGALRLAALEQVLVPLLAKAPQITNEAFHAWHYTSDHRVWNAERERWSADVASPDVERTDAGSTKEPVSSLNHDGSTSDRVQGALAVAQGSAGTALPSPLRARLESHASVDLSEVRIHTGAESEAAADAVGAQAYAVGQDIYFGAGAYDPGSESGQHLIAHEVAHTIQQRGAAPHPQYKLAVTNPGDAAEVEADRFSDSFSSGGQSVAITSHSAAIARETRRPTTSAKGPLTPTEVKRKQTLMKGWEERGLDELKDLVELLERAGETSYKANTPEHKLNAWEETESPKPFDKWSPLYHRNMRNALGGLDREADFRTALDNGNGKVRSRRFETPRGDRQVDAWIPGTKEICMQLKTGDVDLTREQHGGQLPNYEAILRDRALIRQGKEVVWVVEGSTSRQLRDMFTGMTVPAGPPITLIEGPGAFDAAVRRYGLPPPKKGK